MIKRIIVFLNILQPVLSYGSESRISLFQKINSSKNLELFSNSLIVYRVKKDCFKNAMQFKSQARGIYYYGLLRPCLKNNANVEYTISPIIGMNGIHTRYSINDKIVKESQLSVCKITLNDKEYLSNLSNKNKIQIAFMSYKDAPAILNTLLESRVN